MELSKVSRPSVHDEVLEALKRFIAESGLREDERLPGESELAARLDSGIAAINAASFRSAAAGWVSVHRGIGDLGPTEA